MDPQTAAAVARRELGERATLVGWFDEGLKHTTYAVSDGDDPSEPDTHTVRQSTTRTSREAARLAQWPPVLIIRVIGTFDSR